MTKQKRAARTRAMQAGRRQYRKWRAMLRASQSVGAIEAATPTGADLAWARDALTASTLRYADMLLTSDAGLMCGDGRRLTGPRKG